jgi:hypothetical protein
MTDQIDVLLHLSECISSTQSGDKLTITLLSRGVVCVVEERITVFSVIWSSN